jgi:hypothetical protein
MLGRVGIPNPRRRVTSTTRILRRQCASAGCDFAAPPAESMVAEAV